jgi:hypothetical protein
METIEFDSEDDDLCQGCQRSHSNRCPEILTIGCFSLKHGGKIVSVSINRVSGTEQKQPGATA